jgi:hypothetical protein
MALIKSIHLPVGLYPQFTEDMGQQLQQVFRTHAEVTLCPVFLQDIYHLAQALPPCKHTHQGCLSAICMNTEILSGNIYIQHWQVPAGEWVMSGSGPLGTLQRRISIYLLRSEPQATSPQDIIKLQQLMYIVFLIHCALLQIANMVKMGPHHYM